MYTHSSIVTVCALNSAVVAGRAAFLYMAQQLISAGRFVILLNGRHAGKKAVVIASYPQPTEERKYPHCLVLGISEAPKKLTKGMTQEQLTKRTQVKLFMKLVNYNHLLLTRHTLVDDDFWGKAKPDDIVASLGDASTKKACLDNLAKILRQKYLNNKFPWFFKAMAF